MCAWDRQFSFLLCISLSDAPEELQVGDCERSSQDLSNGTLYAKIALEIKSQCSF